MVIGINGGGLESCSRRNLLLPNWHYVKHKQIIKTARLNHKNTKISNTILGLLAFAGVRIAIMFATFLFDVAFIQKNLVKKNQCGCPSGKELCY